MHAQNNQTAPWTAQRAGPTVWLCDVASYKAII